MRPWVLSVAEESISKQARYLREGGVVYGIKYAKDNLFTAFNISAMSYAYLNGQKSSVVDLNALSYEERDRSKIEIEHIWMLDIDNKEVTTRSKDDVLGDGKLRQDHLAF